ncbi:hypothetical protein HY988_05235 [Candidatus Micrarchaeota archaeon]|nr:hypothetical protein [Candidatus Micrarchaeota archaeon]
MIVEICAGGIIIACIVVIAYLLLKNAPISCERKIHGDKALIKITANKDIQKVEIVGRFGGEEIAFERKDIKKGQKLEFSYPASTEKAKVTFYEKDGKGKSVEV